MRLSIDDLRVQSYATQVSELELTEVKGGSTPLCYVAVAAIAAVGTVVVAVIVAANDHKECGSTTTTSGGTTTTTHNCQE